MIVKSLQILRSLSLHRKFSNPLKWLPCCLSCYHPVKRRFSTVEVVQYCSELRGNHQYCGGYSVTAGG